MEKDPLTNEGGMMWMLDARVPGGDIGNIFEQAGIRQVFTTERFKNLKNVYGGLADEE